ncbi:MAG: hypothetical protein H0W62_07935 [Chitinophagales bacterium]|nr:hypothetical protein [Chitinophagales bacterium]
MKKSGLYLYLLGLMHVLSSNCLFAQSLKQPDEFFNTRDSLPKIFLVGTFHFEYYNLDAYKTDKEKQIDILSPQKQNELQELLDYLSLYKPDKIAVESKPAWNAQAKYRDYKSGKAPLSRDEISQIAFRLMDRFHLDTIYSIDAGSIYDDMEILKDSAVFHPYLDSLFKDYDFQSNDAVSKRYINFYNYQTTLATEIPLLKYFKYINSDEILKRNYGAYLTGDFKLGNNRGADALAMYWYDRNLRIFRNIQKITTSPHDRILVLFGSGHMSILNQLFDCSPEYEYIKFNDLKKE